jgi:hypothetical protein
LGKRSHEINATSGIRTRSAANRTIPSGAVSRPRFLGRTKPRKTSIKAPARSDSLHPLAFSTRTPSTNSYSRPSRSCMASTSFSVAVPGAGRSHMHPGPDVLVQLGLRHQATGVLDQILQDRQEPCPQREGPARRATSLPGAARAPAERAQRQCGAQNPSGLLYLGWNSIKHIRAQN